MTLLTIEQVDSLKLQAQNYGFDPSWIVDVVAKYGPDILTIVTELVKDGFTVATVVNLLAKFGPEFLQLLLNILNIKTKMKIASDEFPPDDSGVTSDAILIAVMKQYLPILFQKYGPQIQQAILNDILKIITSGSTA